MAISEELERKIAATKEVLAQISRDYSPAAFANSFGAEDMVLTDLICKHAPGIEIFSLDTGRLPEETYRLMQQAMRHYAIHFQVYFPERHDVEEFERRHGPNAFYDGVEFRKRCCHIRKVLPLQRALQGKKAWITGLRREQAVTRTEVSVAEWDATNGLQKFNPLSDWTHREVWEYIRHYRVPYNELHDRHYPSIGCAPCTRAIAAGEDLRAGRWWWESPETKECGLHATKTSAGK